MQGLKGGHLEVLNCPKASGRCVSRPMPINPVSGSLGEFSFVSSSIGVIVDSRVLWLPNCARQSPGKRLISMYLVARS